ncbi:MAG: hypothetical protein A2Z20_09490 [Bdellovibrionales bacterium RBG_16_40_8]|nr:MAG: hypothetical protein A2Z20_09490 [Bdellovibrionales bacterium RBG_16_40_8]
MINIRVSIFLLISIFSILGLYFLQKQKESALMTNDYAIQITKFRKELDERLRSADGWLTVVGLTWLKDGENPIGSANTNDVVLPPSVATSLGKIYLLNNKKAEIQFTDVTNVKINAAPAKVGIRYSLFYDTSDKPTIVQINSVSFFLIKRKNGVGVRVKDSSAEARTKFNGRNWYPIKKEFVVNAEWVAHEMPRKMLMPDVLGNTNEELSPGLARFKLDNQIVELHPIQENNSLFFVFRDQTSGKETYGAARFLYTDMPQNGHITLDFNKAVNPPCAFTHFATCPMPPPENIVKLSVSAGELIAKTQ